MINFCTEFFYSKSLNTVTENRIKIALYDLFVQNKQNKILPYDILMVNILFWNNTDFLITSALSSVLEMAQWVEMSEPACVMRNAVGSSLDSNRNFFCALHIVFIIH